MKEYYAFTLKSPHQLNVLITNTIVLSDYRNNSSDSEIYNWKGIWDTGASKSSISNRIAEKLDLIPIGKAQISTANGIAAVPTYLVDFVLPNSVVFKNIIVSGADLGDDVDLLIGMDIIKHGDFTITNTNGHTTFSFRIPSIEEVDYVKEHREQKKLNDAGIIE